MNETGATMPTFIIRITELRVQNAENVEDLAEFLEGKFDKAVDVTSDEIALKFEEGEKAPSKSHLRVILRKFLHKTDLKEDFRVISGGENVFTIKEIKG